MPSARVGYIGLQRDEHDGRRVAGTTRSCPHGLGDSYVLMIDPMLATGGSASAALELLRRPAPRAFASSASSPRRKAWPSSSAIIPTSSIYTPVVDSHLNAQKYIVPGLGDFGDRLVRNALRRAHDSRRSLANSADVDRAQQDHSSAATRSTR